MGRDRIFKVTNCDLKPYKSVYNSLQLRELFHDVLGIKVFLQKIPKIIERKQPVRGVIYSERRLCMTRKLIPEDLASQNVIP